MAKKLEFEPGMEIPMKVKRLNSGFFARHRIKLVMWVLVAEMLASPLADAHPRASALLAFGVLMMVPVGAITSVFLNAVQRAGRLAYCASVKAAW